MKSFLATKYKLFTKVIIAFAFCMALFSNKAEASHAMGMDLPTHAWEATLINSRLTFIAIVVVQVHLQDYR